MDILTTYFPDLTGFQKNQLSALLNLYPEWNAKINIISRNDIEHLAQRHILHSLSIAKIFNFKPQTQIIDVGTGGGFPGIPLAILFPEVKFTLIDSIGKKIEVVNTIITELNLTNAKAVKARSTDIKLKADFIVSRAVTAFPGFVNQVKHLISPLGNNTFANGIIYLKGGEFTEELKPFSNKYQLFSISDFFAEPFFETKKIIYLPIK